MALNTYHISTCILYKLLTYLFQIATYKPKDNGLELEGSLQNNIDSIILPDPNKRPNDWKAECPGLCLECMYMFSHQPYMYMPGDVVLPAIFDVHKSGEFPFSCGDLSENGFLITEAFAFAVDMVNAGTGPVKLNAGQLGRLVFDGCSNPTRTNQLVTSFVGFSGLGRKELTSDRHPGWMTFSNEGTLEVVDVLQNLGIPLVSPGATSPLLNNKLKYPGTFYRTVPSDSKIAMALLQIAKEMGFNYTVTVNAPDSANRALKDEFKRMAKDYGVCVAASYEFGIDGTSDTILKAVIGHNTDIVFVFTESISDLENLLDSKGKSDQYNNVVFLTNRDLQRLIDRANTARISDAFNSISLDLENLQVSDLDARLRAQYDDPFSDHGNPWFREHFQNRFKCSFPGDWTYASGCNKQTAVFEQGRWVLPVIDAVFSFAQAVHRTLQETCGSNYTSVCQSFSRAADVHSRILANLAPVNYLYPSNQPFSFIGRESSRKIRALRVKADFTTEEVSKSNSFLLTSENADHISFFSC